MVRVKAARNNTDPHEAIQIGNKANQIGTKEKAKEKAEAEIPLLTGE